MRKLGLVVGACLVAVYVAALMVPFEPDEQRPGTRLGGPLAANQTPGWTDYEPRTKIFVETRTWYGIPHSVTTVSWARDGQLYVPCGRCAGKRWPDNVAADPRVRLKINGEIYERIAVKITDDESRRRILGTPAGDPLPDVAIFRMDG